MSGIEGLLAGRVLGGRYHVEAVIGRGGMGAVYRAADQRLGRPVAVKVVMVHAESAEARERLRQRFHREAQSAARLRHPNVVVVHDFGTDPDLGLDYLVMELLDGEDLAALLSRSGAPPAGTALEILDQAARGLAAGHRTGLVHRDVKPGNLFLARGEAGEEVQAKVLDFGIAQVAVEDETLTHLTVAGRGPLSPAYASPEQLRGESHLTPATDVYSLGAVALYLLTGEKALSGSPGADREAEAASALDRLERTPGVPPAVAAVLRRALDPDPRARFPDAGALREALRGALQGAPLPPAPPPTPRPVPHAPPPPRARSPWRVALQVLGLLLLAVGGYALYRSGAAPAGSGAAGPDTLAPVLAAPPEGRAEEPPLPELPLPDTQLLGVPAVADTTAAPPPASVRTVYGVEELDEQPRLRNRDDVERRLRREYPRSLLRRGISGETTVRFVVDQEGRVDPSTVEVVSSSHEAFSDPARRVAERMRFDPGTVGGEPVRVLVLFPIAWNMEP